MKKNHQPRLRHAKMCGSMEDEVIITRVMIGSCKRHMCGHMGSAQPSQSPCSSLARAFRLRSLSLPVGRLPPLGFPFFFTAGAVLSTSAAPGVAADAAAAVKVASVVIGGAVVVVVADGTATVVAAAVVAASAAPVVVELLSSSLSK